MIIFIKSELQEYAEGLSPCVEAIRWNPSTNSGHAVALMGRESTRLYPEYFN